MEKTDELEEMEVSDDRDVFDASDEDEDGVDTAEDGWSIVTGLFGRGSGSESESESVLLFIESSGSVPNRLCCSDVR